MVRRSLAAVITVVALVGALALTAEASTSRGGTFLGRLHVLSRIGSTVPRNGDLNPYGVAVVTRSGGKLVAGDTLVSNFNAKINVQGTGSTIVEITPSGGQRLFSRIASLPAGLHCPGGVGLDTALAVLPGNWVIVGSLPTAAAGNLPGGEPAGCLIVLNDRGAVVRTIASRAIVGPWDLTTSATSSTSASVFVSNALGGDTKERHGIPVAGNCTIVRLDLSLRGAQPPSLRRVTVIGRDFPWQANAVALDLAPTGLALSRSGTLFVDDTLTSSVSAIPHALTRTTPLRASATRIASHGALNQPLGMVALPNGDILVVNGNDGNAIEINPHGVQLLSKTVIHNGAGDLFGIALSPSRTSLLVADDGTNTLDLYHS